MHASFQINRAREWRENKSLSLRVRLKKLSLKENPFFSRNALSVKISFVFLFARLLYLAKPDPGRILDLCYLQTRIIANGTFRRKEIGKYYLVASIFKLYWPPLSSS